MKKKRLSILIILFLAIAGIVSFIIYSYSLSTDDIEEEPAVEVDTIEGYGYTLEERDTELFKEKFNELKEVLNEEEIDYSAYASLLAELYIIDLYTISNKVNLYDVGGAEFVLPSSKDNYELKVKDTLYKYVEDNSDNSREQELPEVSETNVTSVSEEDDEYVVLIEWSYVSDLGYDTGATITLQNYDNILYIIKQETS